MFGEILLWLCIVSFIIGIRIVIINYNHYEIEKGIKIIVISSISFLLIVCIFGLSSAAYSTEKFLYSENTQVETLELYTLHTSNNEVSDSSSRGIFILAFGTYKYETNTFIESEYQFMVKDSDGWVRPKSLFLDKDTMENVYYKEDNTLEPSYTIEKYTKTKALLITEEPKGILMNLFFKKNTGEYIEYYQAPEVKVSYYFVIPEGSIKQEYILT